MGRREENNLFRSGVLKLISKIKSFVVGEERDICFSNHIFWLPRIKQKGFMNVPNNAPLFPDSLLSRKEVQAKCDIFWRTNLLGGMITGRRKKTMQLAEDSFPTLLFWECYTMWTWFPTRISTVKNRVLHNSQDDYINMQSCLLQSCLHLCFPW